MLSINVKSKCISAYHDKYDRERNSGNALRSRSLSVLAVVRSKLLLRIEVVFDAFKCTNW